MTLTQALVDLVKYLVRALAGIIAFVAVVFVVLFGVGKLVPENRVAGVLVVIIVGLLLAWAVHAASRTGSRLRRSGRDPRDTGPIEGEAHHETPGHPH